MTRTEMGSVSEGVHVRVPIRTDGDIVFARRKGRELADQCGFSSTDQAIVGVVISELARNIVRYAVHGDIVVTRVENDHAHGIEVVAVDRGPGIPDVELALQDGYSTSGGLGRGLPGVRRLMDEFHIVSESASGTIVRARKWRRA